MRATIHIDKVTWNWQCELREYVISFSDRIGSNQNGSLFNSHGFAHELDSPTWQEKESHRQPTNPMFWLNMSKFCYILLFVFVRFFPCFFFVLFISHNFDRVSLHRLLVILGINRGEKRVHIKASIKYGLNPFKTSYNNKGFEYLKSKLKRKKCACNQCTQKKMHLKWDVELSTSKRNQMRSIVGRHCIEMDIEMKVRSNRSKCTLYNVQACLCSFIPPFMVRLWIHKKFYSNLY